jgi:zinc transport system substrate-binding protein
MRKTLLLFLILLASCFAPASKSSKPVVLVTIPPYAYFVERIAGDAVSIEIFVPSGISPHDYEPTPRQIEKFIGANLWLRCGEPGEQKVLPFLRKNHVKDVNLSEGLDGLSLSDHTCAHRHEGKDLHFWLDPVIALQQCKKIHEQLNLLLPEHQNQFTENFKQLTMDLESLDEKIRSELTPLQGSYLLLSHPALGYYCKRYGLHQLSVECEGKEPLPQQVAKVVKEAQENHVKVIFTEPQYNNKGAVLIADKLQLPIYEINPYAGDYFKMMNEITDTIVKYYGH